MALKTESISHKMIKAYTGKEISTYISELTNITNECNSWHEKISRVIADSRSQGLVNYVDKYLDKFSVSSTTDQFSEYNTACYNAEQELDRILTLSRSSICEIRQRRCDKYECETVLKEEEDILRQQALRTYYDMQEMNCIDKYMDKVNDRLLISPLCNYRELYDADHAEFALTIANDNNITKEDTDAFIVNILTCGIHDNEQEYGWLDKKLRRYSKDFDKFIELIFRYCQRKTYKWTKTVHFIYQWLKTNQKTENRSEGKFYYYMVAKFPEGCPNSFNSYNSNSKLEPDEKKEMFRNFDVIATIHLPVA